MRTLIDFAIRAEYARVKALGDDLSEIGSLINWERFRFLEPLIYKNKTSRGGRPNIDIVIMVKALVIQHWFGLTDPELERQVADRISFRIFLGTTEVIPDFSTVWLFRERLIKCDVYEDLWNELQRQLDEMGFTVKNGTPRMQPSRPGIPAGHSRTSRDGRAAAGRDAGRDGNHAALRGILGERVEIRRRRGFERRQKILLRRGDVAEAVEDDERELGFGFEREFGI